MKLVNCDVKVVSAINNLCLNNYNDKTYKHVVRVANYVKDNMFLLSNADWFTYCVAMCHDLIEDTRITFDDIKRVCTIDGCIQEYCGFTIADCVLSLTHNKSMESYIEYLQRIKNLQNSVVYVVKLADMKDHLMQTETLTDKLKEKYINSIGYLL